jgi:hypothetical protein
LDASHYGGNEIVLEEEKDPDMEGMIHFTGGEIRGGQFRPDSITELADDLGTTVRIQGPFMDGRRVQEITLYNQLSRIDFRTELRGFPGHDGIVTVVFPLRRRGGVKAAHETHNAVTERPDGIYDAHTWVDVGDSNGGAAILNQGTGGIKLTGRTSSLFYFVPSLTIVDITPPKLRKPATTSSSIACTRTPAIGAVVESWSRPIDSTVP